MVKQLGTPHAFITFSAADIQWSDLHCHMPHASPMPGDERTCQRLNRQRLNDNPAIAAWWFQHRFHLFFKHVLSKIFNIDNFWYHFEWQHRGSSHVHGLIWIRDAPSIAGLDPSNPSTCRDFLDFWSQHATAYHPCKDAAPAVIHPCAVQFEDMNFTNLALAEMLNRVQRHTQCTSYCLRRPKNSAPDAQKVRREIVRLLTSLDMSISVSHCLPVTGACREQPHWLLAVSRCLK